MRSLLIVLGAILVLLILAVLVGPLLVDWNAFKPRLAAAVEEATGRQLDIEGDLELSLLPTPTLSAEGARLANVPGGSEPTMISLDTLQVQVALAPLLGGELQVESLVLVEPTILLERLADGRTNWDFAPAEVPRPAGQPAGQPGAGGGAPALAVSLERLRIENGTLVYRDAASGSAERIEALDATLVSDSLRGPFRLEGEARLRGTPAGFALSSGRLALGGATPVTATLSLPEAGNAEARFDGEVTWGGTPGGGTPGDGTAGAGTAEEATGVAGELTLRGDSLLALAALAVPGAELPGTLAQGYAFSTRLGYGRGRLALDELDLSMAASALSGEAAVGFGEPTELQAELTVSRLDLDALLADGGGGGQDPAPPASGFALPAGLRAQLDLQIDTLIYRGEVVRQVLVNADLQEGRLVLNQALALLPGGGNLVLSGELTAEQDLPHFAGRVEATADNLRAVLSWLGVEVAGVPSDRLRRSSLLADLDVTPRQASVTGIDLEVDTSRITGGVVLALRERLGVGLGLTVDRVNLDAYLGAETAAAAAPAGAAGTAEQAGKGTAPDGPEAPAGGPAALLGAIDANIDLTLGQITYNGQSARQVTLDGTLQQGRLTLRRLTVGDLAGGAFSLSGVFAGLPDAPSVEDGSFEVTVTDTARLSRLLGRPADGPLARLGSFRASGSASGSAQGFSYNTDVTALGGSVFSSGQVSGLPDEPAIRDARVQASDLQGAALARVAGMPADSPLARLDSLEVASRFSYVGGAATYDTQLRTLGAELAAEGTASGFASGLPEVDFRFAASHADLALLLRRALGDSPLSPGAGRLDLRGRVTGTPLKLQIAELAGEAGPSVESGTIAIDLARATPFARAELKTGEIDLARLFGDGGGGGQDPAARWSRQPLDLAGLRGLDAELALDAQALRRDDLVLAPATLRATLSGGLLSLERLAGSFYQGALDASGRLDASGGQPSATLSLSLAGMDAGAFLRARGTDRVDGTLDLKAELATRGDSEAALVTALDGQGEVGGALTVQARAQEQVGNIVLGILGQQVKELRGVTNPLNELFSAFAGQPGRLAGSVQVAQGVATTQDLQLTGSGARLSARGTLADLPAWLIDLDTALYRDGGEAPQLEIELTGPLDEPNVRLQGAALSITPGSGAPEPATPNPLEQILRQAIPGARQPEPAQPSDPLEIAPEAPAGDQESGGDQGRTQQQESQPPKPADVLRGLIQGLGKGG